jgi:hypothetical protein
MSALVFERRAGAIAVLALVLCLAGCSEEGKVVATEPKPLPMPAPASPAAAVRALEWCWDHRNLDAYTGILTGDFLGFCAVADTAGNVFRANALTRDDELVIARHLFVGGGTQPPANNITLQFDQNLYAVPDTRPGREDASRYQMITTTITLRIDSFASDFQVTGRAHFYLVRGDVAVIPDELVARGVQPDAGRWYVERWEDESVGAPAPGAGARDAPGEALRTMPAKQSTWCSVKALYR